MTRVLATILALAGSLSAADTAPVPAPKATPYPLDICIASGDKLGSMGDAIVIVREGQEIKLCCKGCIKDVDKDVPKTLQKIKDAVAKKAEDAKKGETPKAPEAPKAPDAPKH